MCDKLDRVRLFQLNFVPRNLREVFIQCGDIMRKKLVYPHWKVYHQLYSDSVKRYDLMLRRHSPARRSTTKVSLNLLSKLLILFIIVTCKKHIQLTYYIGHLYVSVDTCVGNFTISLIITTIIAKRRVFKWLQILALSLQQK